VEETSLCSFPHVLNDGCLAGHMELMPCDWGGGRADGGQLSRVQAHIAGLSLRWTLMKCPDPGKRFLLGLPEARPPI
jgi:hypothetical protein